MCHKLLLIYDCDCMKEVCTTPCPHALATATHQRPQSTDSIRRKPRPPYPVSPTSSTPSLPTNATVPADRNVSLSTKPSVSSLSTRSLSTRTTRSQPAADLLAHPQQTLANRDSSPPPNLCPYFFKHFTPRSSYPCVQCYHKPKYQELRRRWMADYASAHFGVKPEDVGRLSGVEGIAERVEGVMRGA